MDSDSFTLGHRGQHRSGRLARARRFAVPAICLAGLATVGTAAGAWALSPGRPDPHRSGPPPAHASGTVASVGTTSFTVTPESGSNEKSTSSITIDTSSHTNYTQTTTASVSDATAGTYVEVTGSRGSDGSLTAGAIAIVPAPPNPPAGTSTTATSSTPTPRGPFAFGEVTSNSSGTVTLATREGTQTVITTSAPTVTTTSKAGFSAIGTGDTVSVAGRWGGKATIDAFIVNVGVQPAVEQAGPTHAGPGQGGPPWSGQGTPGQPGATTTASTSATGTTPVPPGPVSGTVGTVAAPNFTVNESSGSSTTVVTSTDTHYALTATAPVSDATPGSFVVAKGTRASDESLAATALSILPGTGQGTGWSGPSGSNNTGSNKASSNNASGGWNGPGSGWGGGSYAAGVVQSNSAGTLTLSDGRGTQSVTTSGSTTVTKTSSVGFSSVTAGEAVTVLGKPAGTDTVDAFVVSLGMTPAVMGLPESGGAPPALNGTPAHAPTQWPTGRSGPATSAPGAPSGNVGGENGSPTTHGPFPSAPTPGETWPGSGAPGAGHTGGPTSGEVDGRGPSAPSGGIPGGAPTGGGAPGQGQPGR